MSPFSGVGMADAMSTAAGNFAGNSAGNSTAGAANVGAANTGASNTGAANSSDLDIRVLGALALHVHGAPVTPSARKLRQLLALLLLNANQVVSVSYLINGLWDASPPANALGTLHTYVLQLRRGIASALPPGGVSAKEILVTRGDAYLFLVGDGALDLHRYRRDVRDGESALRAGEYPRAMALLRGALELWDGEPLSDVRLTPILEGEVRRLRQSRLHVLELRFDLELQLGRHRESLDELAMLCERYRCHENFYQQYMVALHRSGRRFEALNVYQRLRAQLVSELGLDPSAHLQQLHRAILGAEATVHLTDRYSILDLGPNRSRQMI